MIGSVGICAKDGQSEFDWSQKTGSIHSYPPAKGRTPTIRYLGPLESVQARDGQSENNWPRKSGSIFGYLPGYIRNVKCIRKPLPIPVLQWESSAFSHH